MTSATLRSALEQSVALGDLRALQAEAADVLDRLASGIQRLSVAGAGRRRAVALADAMSAEAHLKGVRDWLDAIEAGDG